MEELDIWRTATLLMGQYGDGAPSFAARRADALRQQGALDGCAVWIQIGRAIEELGRQRPRDGEMFN